MLYVVYCSAIEDKYFMERNLGGRYFFLSKCTYNPKIVVNERSNALALNVL